MRKERYRDTINERQYSQHQQVAPTDNDVVESLYKAPIGTAAMPSSGSAYRNVQQNNTPFATKRTKGANLKKFNV